MDLKQLLDGAGDEPLDQQPITWDPAPWRARGNPIINVAIGALEEETRKSGGYGTIRRSYLHDLATADPLQLLVATMVWGFGPYKVGPYRVDQMISKPPRGGGKTADVAAEIVTRVRSNGADDGFAALFHAGRPRLPWLGIAFGTKYLHFAGYTAGLTPRPLVLDKRVWGASTTLTGCPTLPDPERYTTSAMYAEYCAWAEGVASQFGLEPAEVEYALFRHGGRQ